MRIPPQIIERILRRQVVTMEVPQGDDRLRCFIGVYPMLTANGDLELTARKFSVYRNYLDDDLDIHPEELIDPRNAVVTSIPELERLIEEWGADPAELAPPWKNDYPL